MDGARAPWAASELRCLHYRTLDLIRPNALALITRIVFCSLWTYNWLHELIPHLTGLTSKIGDRMGTVTSVVKRSGVIVPFNPDRITNAIYRAAVAVGGRDRSIAEGLTGQVVQYLEGQTL